MATGTVLSHDCVAAAYGDGVNLGIAAIMAGGKIAVYGSASTNNRPANPAAVVSGCSPTAVLIGVYTIGTITQSNNQLVFTCSAVNALSSATAYWARIYKSGFSVIGNDATVVHLADIDVLNNVSGDGLNLTNITVTAGTQLGQLLNATLTIPSY